MDEREARLLARVKKAAELGQEVANENDKLLKENALLRDQLADAVKVAGGDGRVKDPRQKPAPLSRERFEQLEAEVKRLRGVMVAVSFGCLEAASKNWGVEGLKAELKHAGKVLQRAASRT